MTVRLFPFLAGDHPLRCCVDRFEAEVHARGGTLSSGSHGDETVHADVRLEPSTSGVRATSLYWSIQRRAACGFVASTLTSSRDDREIKWLEFPADPRLPALAPYLHRNADVDVLRYIPLRRATLGIRTRSGYGLVAKVKRASRFRDAWHTLHIVERQVTAGRVSFRVPRALGLDETRCLYLQEAMPGVTLAALLDEHSGPALLGRLGELHAELHALPARGLPLRDSTALVHEAASNAAAIVYMLPALHDRVAELLGAMTRALPPAAYGFCHGDPDCGQVLVDGDRWSLIDFDSAHAGDAGRDVAMLLASLDYHVPRFRTLLEDGSDTAAHAIDRARDAYLETYCARAPRVRSHLAWHRACAELYYLALVLRKDRYHPRAFARRWERFEAHVAGLQPVA
jgi:aminoglycoside phosphotransferase (APT) family kinase protein